MAPSPKPPSPTALRVAVTIVHPVAIFCTAFRLGFRYTRLRFWWDDVLAGISMVLDLVCLITIWILTENQGSGPSNQAIMVAYWFASISFTSVLWTARLSILYSVMRITPATMTLRRITYAMVVLFGVMYISIIIQKIYVCVHDGRWEREPILQCHLGHGVAITELTTDCIADVILVALPWCLLSRIRLSKAHRRLLSTVFSASLVTTAVSIPHAVFVLGPEGILSDITAHIEAGVSLIVANLLVIITYIYQVVRRGQYIDDQSLPAPAVDDPRRASLPHTLNAHPDWTHSTILNTYDLQQIGVPESEGEASRTSRVDAGSGVNTTTMADPPLRRDIFDDGSSSSSGSLNYTKCS